jgi:hypothetical protein
MILVNWSSFIGMKVVLDLSARAAAAHHHGAPVGARNYFRIQRIRSNLRRHPSTAIKTALRTRQSILRRSTTVWLASRFETATHNSHASFHRGAL